MTRVHLLDARQPGFPPADRALRDPNGLLAVGGELTSAWLLAAYRSGVFPWYDDDRGPILWWSPDPRAVLFPAEVRVSRRLARTLRNGPFTVTFDTAFNQVVRGCAAPRAGASGTWITPRMQRAYQRLHRSGYAHSCEVWQEEALVGGLYGVSLGGMFFGESMFFRATDASKVALVTLIRAIDRWGFSLLDCQVMNPHLDSLGAREIRREAFLELLERSLEQPTRRGSWSADSPEPQDQTRAGRTGQ
ncbi:MAG: leucyl/phenylalanyl-tRNA--protein transferase [Pseudomonadales bacterium]